MLGRSLVRAAQKATTRYGVARCASATTRSMVTLAEKERGEEARFFAKEDAKATADMRAAMEKILAQEDGSESKEQLMEVLGKCFCPSFE
jgi:hypothetical protein